MQEFISNQQEKIGLPLIVFNLLKEAIRVVQICENLLKSRQQQPLILSQNEELLHQHHVTQLLNQFLKSSNQILELLAKKLLPAKFGPSNLLVNQTNASYDLHIKICYEKQRNFTINLQKLFPKSQMLLPKKTIIQDSFQTKKYLTSSINQDNHILSIQQKSQQTSQAQDKQTLQIQFLMINQIKIKNRLNEQASYFVQTLYDQLFPRQIIVEQTLIVDCSQSLQESDFRNQSEAQQQEKRPLTRKQQNRLRHQQDQRLKSQTKLKNQSVNQKLKYIINPQIVQDRFNPFFLYIYQKKKQFQFFISQPLLQMIKRFHQKKSIQKQYIQRNNTTKIFMEEHEKITKNLRSLWFIGMDKLQIQEKIQKFSDKQINQFKIQIQQKWSLFVEQYQQFICKKHKKTIYYLCLNEKQKQKIYLCNQCILNIQQNNLNDHQIVCQEHKNTIMYKTTQNYNDQKQFLCQNCLSQFHEPKINFLSQCHYKEISTICTNQQCIKNDEFKICSLCEQKHQNHKKVDLTEQSLMEYFNLDKNYRVTDVQSLYIKIKQSLKLNSILKIIGEYQKQICCNVKLFESFLVCDKISLNKWVKSVLTEMKKEDILVLLGVTKLKNLFDEKERSDYLQVFNDLLQKQIEELLKDLSKRLSIFTKSVKSITEIQKDKVQQHLDIKHRQYLDIETKDRFVISPGVIAQINSNHCQRIKEIHVEKQKEQTREQRIFKTKKRSWIKFFQMNDQEINKIFVMQETQKQNKIHLLKQMFFGKTKKYSEQLDIDLNKLQQLQINEKQIQQLIKLFKSMQEKYFKELRQCGPMTKIIQLKLEKLQVIHIQYKPYFQPKYNYANRKYQNYCYSISAFKLFEVVHRNKSLKQLTLKGVIVRKFQLFIKLIKAASQNNKYQLKKEQFWMREFQESKFLKLRIDAQLQFGLSKKQQNLSKISDLQFFCKLFHSVSDITTIIYFGRWEKIDLWGNNLQDLWSCLKQLKKISIKIQGIYNDQFFVQSAPKTRQIVLQGLASFKQIVYLSFNWIDFNKQVSQDQFKAIEKSFDKIFANNQVLRLELNSCQYFPKLTNIKNLESIYMNGLVFRQNYGLINQVTQCNPALTSIKCCRIDENWNISDKLFNQLETLIIFDCKGFKFNNLSADVSSSLRHLSIEESNFQNTENLSIILPKLAHISYLSISGIDFDAQILKTIPSIHLNNKIVNKGLKAIDQNWPYIKQLKLKKCSQISSKVWGSCYFKGLIRLCVDSKIMSEEFAFLFRKNRGINVHID